MKMKCRNSNREVNWIIILSIDRSTVEWWLRLKLITNHFTFVPNPSPVNLGNLYCFRQLLAAMRISTRWIHFIISHPVRVLNQFGEYFRQLEDRSTHFCKINSLQHLPAVRSMHISLKWILLILIHTSKKVPPPFSLKVRNTVKSSYLCRVLSSFFFHVVIFLFSSPELHEFLGFPENRQEY